MKDFFMKLSASFLVITLFFLFSCDSLCMETNAADSRKEMSVLVAGIKNITDAQSLMSILSGERYGNSWITAFKLILERREQIGDSWIAITELFASTFGVRLSGLSAEYNADLYALSGLFDACRFKWHRSLILVKFYNNDRLESVRKMRRRSSLDMLRVAHIQKSLRRRTIDPFEGSKLQNALVTNERIDTLRSELLQAEDLIAQLKAKDLENKTTLDSLQRRFIQAEEALRVYEGTSQQTLLRELQVLKEAYAQSQKKVSELEGRIVYLHNERPSVSRDSEELDSARKRLSIAEQELKEKDRQLQQATSGELVIQLQQRMNAFNEEVSALRKNKDASDQEVIALKAELDKTVIDYEGKMSSNTAQLLEVQESLKKALSGEALVALQAEIGALKKTALEKDKKELEQKALIEDLKAQLTSAKAVNDQMTAQVAQQKSELEAVKNSLAAKEQEIVTVTVQKNTYASVYSDYFNKYTNAEKELAKARQDLATARAAQVQKEKHSAGLRVALDKARVAYVDAARLIIVWDEGNVWNLKTTRKEMRKKIEEQYDSLGVLERETEGYGSDFTALHQRIKAGRDILLQMMQQVNGYLYASSWVPSDERAYKKALHDKYQELTRNSLRIY